jgi:phytoene dehydrogenase-like protein
LAKGVTKHRGKILTRAHVEEVIVSDGRAKGVKLRDGRQLEAKVAVVSNADMKTTFDLVRRGQHVEFDQERDRLLNETTLCDSFMHLHLGIDASDLPKDIPPQWTVCNDWNLVRLLIVCASE